MREWMLSWYEMRFEFRGRAESWEYQNITQKYFSRTNRSKSSIVCAQIHPATVKCEIMRRNEKIYWLENCVTSPRTVMMFLLPSIDCIWEPHQRTTSVRNKIETKVNQMRRLVMISLLQTFFFVIERNFEKWEKWMK